MMKLLPIALVAFVSAPAFAQSAPTQSTVANPDKPELDRIVCEREEQIGTRLAGRKVCKTVREWQEQRRVQRDEVERVQRTVNMSPSG